MLTVPPPLVFAYCSDVLLLDDICASAIWHIVLTKCVVVALLRFLGAAPDHAVGVACIDARMHGSDFRVLVPFLSVVPEKFNDICCPEIILLVVLILSPH